MSAVGFSGEPGRGASGRWRAYYKDPQEGNAKGNKWRSNEEVGLLMAPASLRDPTLVATAAALDRMILSTLPPLPDATASPSFQAGFPLAAIVPFRHCFRPPLADSPSSRRRWEPEPDGHRGLG